MHRARLLIASAMLVGLVLAAGVRPTLAGFDGPTCCLCQCQGRATQCADAVSANDCSAFLNSCGDDLNATCRTGTTGGPCSVLGAECANLAAAPAPALDVTGLAIGVIVLSGLAALRLRRAAVRRATAPPPGR